MTEKQKAAARANGRRSRGPVSAEGRERIRAANLRHGLFSQAEGVVLDALGEDRERFESLRQGLYASWPGIDPSQKQWIENLAAAFWRLDRVDRRREELLIRHVTDFSEGGLDYPEAGDPDAFLRLLTMEAVNYREILRIGNRLLKAQTAERERPLPGLPQKIFKTKDNEVVETCRPTTNEGNGPSGRRGPAPEETERPEAASGDHDATK